MQSECIFHGGRGGEDPGDVCARVSRQAPRLIRARTSFPVQNYTMYLRGEHLHGNRILVAKNRGDQ